MSVGLVGCGGSVTPLFGDAGSEAGSPTRDAGRPPPREPDASGGADEGVGPADVAVEGAPPTSLYDGTTGKACSADSDCQTAGGPGRARCSSSVFAPDSYYPTPVCILPSCPTVSDSTTIHYCDGPDDSSSPGVCLPWGGTGTACLPKCTYDAKGDPASGCQGKDVCAAYTAAIENGFGYCWGGCSVDGDCPSGQHCQADRGTCLAEVVTPTKSFGEACTATDYDTYACTCDYGGLTKTGYCSSVCFVGGPDVCPDGYACDSIEYRDDGYSTQNPGMLGYCMATCSGGDAGTCPSNSTCSNLNAAGPDCVP